MFKHLNALFIGLALFACTSGAVAQTIKPIETPVPVRPAGQKDVVGLTTPKLDVVRVRLSRLVHHCGRNTVRIVSRVSVGESSIFEMVCILP